MKIFSHSSVPLTDPLDRLAVLLILLFFLVIPFRALSASDTSSNFFVNPVQQYNNAIDANMADEKRLALLSWVRGKAYGLIPGLPDDVRNPVNWVISTLHNGSGFLSLGFSTLNSEGEEPSPIFHAPGMMQAPLPETGGDSWLASTAYHHHNGLLPTRDAMIAGAHVKQSMFNQYFQYDLHPYAGQNYFSSRNYYGTDLSFDFAKPGDTSRIARPWGTIVVGYTNGDDRLMDHGRGIDMHGELHFNDQLSLNSGVRQSDPSGNSNYVLLQWKLSTE